MASNDPGDWQSSKKSVLERNMHMFNNPLFSDISFTCGKSRRVFHAHKYVLATSSAVFEAMFYGDLAERGPTIRLPDTEDNSFKEFLCFLYTDDCKVSAENAIGVLYLAKKYLISPLVKKCRKVLQKCIKPGNVFAVLEQAIKFDEKELEVKCWDIVSRQTIESINTEAFCSISSRTLTDLLKRETLEIPEVELFKGVLKWVDKECARQGINIEEDVSARRRVLGDNVYDIRFLEMTLEDFGRNVSSSGVLNDAEIVAIFQKLSGLDVAGLKWKKERKWRRVRMLSFERFEIRCFRNLSMNCNWICDGSNSDALALVVNKAVLFHGVRLFGDSNGSQYEVKFMIKDESVTGTYTSQRDDDKVWGYDVMLQEPISILPREEFTICATIKGPDSACGILGYPFMKVDDVVVSVGKAPDNLSSTTTSHIYGQFYKIYLSKL